MALQEQFEAIGGQFLQPATALAEKLQQVHAFIFDWDGVFNNGVNISGEGSPFSEPDSMGLNMLRFSYWLIHGRLPFVAIVTGASNHTAHRFAQREHLHAVMLNAKQKGKAVEWLAKEHAFAPTETLFVFDDILDLSACAICAMAIGIRRKSGPLFTNFLIKHQRCNYLSGSQGGEHAVREITELLIGLQGNYEETVSKREAFGAEYAAYLSARDAVETAFSKAPPVV